MRGLTVFCIILCLCATSFAAGPCGEDEAIVVSVRTEYSRGHVFETDGNEVKTLSYQYVEGIGWKGADGSVYVRTDNGWEYIAPETTTARI